MKQPPFQDLGEILSPQAQQDEFTQALLKPYFGFSGAKLLADGTYVGIKHMITTVAIFIGIEPVTPFKRRYCYKEMIDCIEAYQQLQTGNDEPTGWIARRPETPEDMAAKRRPPPLRDDSFSR